ncbi:MAG: amino acid ABC transporter substrate-binding protein [Chlorobi bacterium]|nr:amino acid ABC transporter substrate-binding protein [Chlorobiota bacterium]
MKTILKWLMFSFLLLFPVFQLTGQEKKKNYGNTPDEIVPYKRFQKAYLNFFDTIQPFTGPGREKAPPANLSEVRIGFLGPLAGSVMVPQGKQMLNGAALAIEEANKGGGYHGIPFKLMVHNDVGLWGAAANKVVEMNDEGVWAFLGTIDGTNSHVALRMTLKLEIPMINTGDPDPTLTETRIPWLIRVISDDRQSSYALAEYIYHIKGLSRAAVVRVDNRYGRVGITEFREASLRMGHPLVLEVRYAEGDTVFTKQIQRITDASPDAIVLWGNAKEAGVLIKQIRAAGIKLPIFGSDRLMSPELLKIAGKDAEGLVTTCQYNPKLDDPKLKAFQKHYYDRFGIEPDVFAAHAYDGMNIIIAAIRKAGLNRYRIRDALTDMKTFQGYHGVTGKIIFDPSWNDIGSIWMTEVRDGKYIFFHSPLDTLVVK